MARVIPYRGRRRTKSAPRLENGSLSSGLPSALSLRRRAALQHLNDLLQVIVLEWPDALSLVVRFVEHLLDSQR